MVGHAAFLIQFGALNIVTDPTWSHRIGPFSWLGPARIHKPGIHFDELPPIDIILISHNHYDHLDMPSLKRLVARDNPKILVPLGDKHWMEKDGITNVIEMDWWENYQYNNQYDITFTPAQHNSGRMIIDNNKSLWGSFMIKKGNQSIFFGGDTGYNKHFKDIQQKLGSPDIALLPIGAYEPRKMMKQVHMNPAEAVQAFKDLKASYALGTHYGTYKTTSEDFDQPSKDLKDAMALNKLDQSRFIAPCVGKTYQFD